MSVRLQRGSPGCSTTFGGRRPKMHMARRMQLSKSLHAALPPLFASKQGYPVLFHSPFPHSVHCISPSDPTKRKIGHCTQARVDFQHGMKSDNTSIGFVFRCPINVVKLPCSILFIMAHKMNPVAVLYDPLACENNHTRVIMKRPVHSLLPLWLGRPVDLSLAATETSSL